MTVAHHGRKLWPVGRAIAIRSSPYIEKLGQGGCGRLVMVTDAGRRVFTAVGGQPKS
jgi:hypothetical protein